MEQIDLANVYFRIPFARQLRLFDIPAVALSGIALSHFYSAYLDLLKLLDLLMFEGRVHLLNVRRMPGALILVKASFDSFNPDLRPLDV